MSDEPLSGAAAAGSLRGRLQLAGVIALIAGYAALSQYSVTSQSKGLGATLSLGPILLVGIVLIWHWTRALIALLVALLAAALLYKWWPEVVKNYEWADLLQQCGIYGLIATSFARSLYAGRTSMCTQLSARMHGALTPIEIAFTRRATAAWAIFYGLLTAAIAILFFATSRRAWSFFVNFAIFGLIILMGVVDHLIRRRVLPRRSGGILAIVKRSLVG